MVLATGCFPIQSAAACQSPVLPMPDTTPPVEVVQRAIASTTSYRALQTRRVCTYNRVIRSAYQTGRSTSARVLRDELAFDTGQPVTDPEVLASSGASPEMFDLWDHPLFQTILRHSVFMPLRSSLSADMRKISNFRFTPDPKFQPSTDLERVAQTVDGVISIDDATGVIIGLQGMAMADAYDGNRLLVLGPRSDEPIPLFTYRAGPADGIIVPTIWDEATFQPVKRGSDEARRWLATLTRTFVHVEGCEDFRVKSTIRPGFGVVKPGSGK